MSEITLSPLSRTAGRGAVRAPWLAARGAVALSLLAAWVHFSHTATHWQSWWGYGAFFLACGIGQALFVPAILRWPRPWLVLSGIAGNLAIVVMYVISRTTGVPVGPHAGVAENAGAADLGVTAAEIALIGVLLVLVGPAQRRWVVNVLLVFGVLMWGLRLTGGLQ